MSRTLKRILLFAAVLASVSFLVLLVNQTLQLTEFAARFHPLAGEGVFWGLIFTYAICLSVPAFLFLRLPSPLIPPDSEEGEEFDEHLDRLARRLSRNPRVDRTQITGRDEIEEALGALDAEAQDRIEAAGSRAFLVTAVSQSGALDALVILGLQSKLVWEVAHIYAQRPTPRDMLYLYSNVLGTAFLATELDEAELSEAIQPVLSSVLGSAASAVPGLQVASTVFVNSVMSGTANAFLTLRVGLIAQEYSRALVRPERSTVRRSAIVQAASMLGSIATEGAKKVSSSIARASGKSITGAISGVGEKFRAAGGAVARRFSGDEETEEDEASPDGKDEQDSPQTEEPR